MLTDQLALCIQIQASLLRVMQLEKKLETVINRICHFKSNILIERWQPKRR